MASEGAKDDTPPVVVKEWVLEGNSEYRFEIDPGQTIGIQVRPRSSQPTLTFFIK